MDIPEGYEATGEYRKPHCTGIVAGAFAEGCVDGYRFEFYL